MATLRRYSIVKTPKHSRIWTPDRAILLAFCVAVAGGVFMTIQTMQFGYKDKEGRFAGVGIGVPIASHLAAALDGAGAPRLARKPSDDPGYARLAAERARQAAVASQLAAERQRTAAQLFNRDAALDRTPVASIDGRPAPSAGTGTGGFRVLASPPAGAGFRELPRWRNAD